MSDVDYLAALMLAGFSGLSATLWAIFEDPGAAWVFPVCLFALAAFLLFLSIVKGGRS